jgi:hypothetical protein
MTADFGNRLMLVAVDAVRRSRVSKARRVHGSRRLPAGAGVWGWPDGFGPALPGLTLLDVTSGMDESAGGPKQAFYVAALSLVLARPSARICCGATSGASCAWPNCARSSSRACRTS